MKGLVLAAALVLGLGFSVTSQAEVNAFGVQLPIEYSEVNNDARGGYVAQSLSDTFQVQKLQNANESKLSGTAYDSDTYYVFGVALDSDSAI